jgi:farnesyl diphosphate synthase/geranylgeranyl diphosphate synthase type II
VSISEAPPVSAESLLAEAREATDQRLHQVAEELGGSVAGAIGEAFSYALQSPGKRVRPALVLGAYRAAGGRSPAAAGVAAAVEIVHTYSLVHDDLPCMDNDDLRRGRATMHRQFDVGTATRAGFLLVPVAARVLADAAGELGLEASLLGTMAVTLFEAGGIEGMVGGQWLDLEAERQVLDLPELIAVHRGKTGALIRASCVLGGLAARASGSGMLALQRYGADIGLAFQIADDVLDVTGTSDQLGKTAGKDEALSKSTYAQLLGIDGARAEAERLARSAIEHLDRAGLASPALGALAHYIVTRNS